MSKIIPGVARSYGAMREVHASGGAGRSLLPPGNLVRTVLDYQGEQYVLTYPCKCCGREIEAAELCSECAKGNDPFKTADNCGSDLAR